VVLATLLFATCVAPQHQTSRLPGVRLALLPPNVHGRLIGRTMRPRFITIHSTENIGATADTHARYLTVKGKRSRNNPRFGRSGWVVWHFTVDDREVVEHLLPTEQGDHADYGGQGDRESIGIEICEFRDRVRQAAAIDRAARLSAVLANRYQIPTSRIAPHIGRAGTFHMESPAPAFCSSAIGKPPADGKPVSSGTVLSRV
jgi:N-acetylmuramoyl-L-alanine amidase CwlA